MRRRAVKHFLCIFFMLITLGIYAQTADAAIINLTKSDEDTAITDIYERITPAIVVVDAEMKDGTSSGTGCIIDSKGIILTSSHVIANASDIQITISSGEVYKGETISVLGKDNDLALIKINPKRELPTLKLGDSAKVKVGQRVLAIGNPFGFNGTLTTGIISRIDYTRNKLQTDAAINPGNSGGPIVNIKGEVIGISQSIYNPDNNVSNIGIGFAVPINEAKSFIKETESKIEKLCNNLGDDTIFIISADHGHKDIEKAYMLLDYPEILECLIMPASLESRSLTFWVKEDMRKVFEERFHQIFKDDFLLMTKEEFLDKHYLGDGEKHPKIDDFIGNYMALSTSSSIIVLETYLAPGKPVKKSTHCGLTKEEMEVPLIVIE